MNPLIKIAIRAGTPDLVRFHLQRGGDINRQDDSGTSLLMYAAALGRAEICQMLLDIGADPTLRNRQGQDALSLAEAAGYHGVKALIQAALTARQTLLESKPEELTDGQVDGEEFDATAWEAEVETPPPEGDPDWSGIEIEIPDLPVSRRGLSSINDARLERIRHLLIQGLQIGRVSRTAIGYALWPDEPDLDGREVLLDSVLGDLGIQIDNWVNGDQSPIFVELDSEQELPEEGAADEALRFLGEAQDLRMDPANCYQRDLNAFSLLTKAGEIHLAQHIEEGMDQVMAALASYPPAVDELLRLYDALRDSGARLTEVVSGFRDVEDTLRGMSASPIC